MDAPETEINSSSPPEGSHLNRNRSFKTKQLVRSVAIRESHSPPRLASPRDSRDATSGGHDARTTVEIQITPNATDADLNCKQHHYDDCESNTICADSGAICADSTRLCAESCPPCAERDPYCVGNSPCPAKDLLLSHNPRITCVCVRCERCCSRRPVKQDSGISCPDDNDDTAETDLRREKLSHLIRADSDGNSDLSGPELIRFIKATLNKNPKDRMTLLKLERELHALVVDSSRCVSLFPMMSSYGRMLVHRCAALFQLSHTTADKSTVRVAKCGGLGGRVPCTQFSAWCSARLQPPPPPQHKFILKRSAHSLDDGTNNNNNNGNNVKTLQQREREYDTLRNRIFSSEECGGTEWESGEDADGVQRHRLVKVVSLESPHVSRQPVAKCHSFGGYTPEQQHRRILSRQGDLASSSWRLSPSSSGYKTLSLRSTDSVTPEPVSESSTPASVSGGTVSGSVGGSGVVPEGSVVYCVSALAAVPRGAMLLHPQTGRPLTTADGRVYRHDGRTPPLPYTHVNAPSEESNEKRRGRLEKQHSFIENETTSYSECEYPADDYTEPYECHTEAYTEVPPEKSTSIPPSPTKQKYEQKEPTNETPPVETTTNHSSPTYSQPTNHVQPYNYHQNSNNLQQTQNYTNNIHNYSAQYNMGNIQAYSIPTNHTQVYNQVANHTQQYGVPANQMTYASANQVQGFETTASTRPSSQVSQQGACKNQDIDLAQYNMQDYTTLYRPHEDSSPQAAMMPYVLSETHALSKTTPAHIADHHLRTVPGGVLCPAVPQYYHPACRLEAQYPAMFPEETHKHTHEHGFRIDGSYPYQAVEQTAAASCVHAPTMGMYPAPTVEAPAVYPVSNVILPQYTMAQYQPLQWQTNIQPILTPSLPACPQKPTSPGVLIPEMPQIPQVPIYQYPMYYPYPVVQQQYYPLYVPERIETNSCRTTPLGGAVQEKVPYRNKNYSAERKFQRSDSTKSDSSIARENSNELALKIQQIKEQMASLSTDKDSKNTSERKDEGKRRNNGNGILGSYPTNIYTSNRPVSAGVGGGCVPPAPAPAPRPPGGGGAAGGAAGGAGGLSAAARAIVDSMRHVQHKYPPSPRRPEVPRDNYQHHNYQHHSYQHNRRRPEEKREDERDRDARPRQGFRPTYVLRQMAPSTWCRRAPAPGYNNGPRRPPPDTRHQRR